MVQNIGKEMFYGTEAAEIAKGVLEGQIQGVDPDECNRCNVCKKTYFEGLENRSLYELPPACAVKASWIKKWMINHDSLYIFDPRSLDSSNDNDDEAVERHAKEAVIVPDNPKDNTKCGVNCCDDY